MGWVGPGDIFGMAESRKVPDFSGRGGNRGRFASASSRVGIRERFAVGDAGRGSIRLGWVCLRSTLGLDAACP